MFELRNQIVLNIRPLSLMKIYTLAEFKINPQPND